MLKLATVFNGTLSTEFAKNSTVAEIPDSYTATQSADDKYAANGADTDAGMYDAFSKLLLVTV